jgi:hypothetical protein
MKPSDWLKIIGMVIGAIVFVVVWVASTDHNVKVNSADIDRVEVVNEKQDEDVEKLEEKAAVIDTRLVQIQTQQSANQRILEKLDNKMDRVLKR